MKNLVLIFFVSALFLYCKSEGANQDEHQERPLGQRTEIGNFEYWHHIKNDGPKPLPSQAVFYQYQIRQGDKIIQTNYGSSPSGGIMPSEEEAKNNPQAIAEALRRMAIGDSVTIIYPIGKHPDSSYVYDIVLRAIHSR